MQLERDPAEVEKVAGIEGPVEAVQIPELDFVDVSKRNLGEDVISRQHLAIQSLLEFLGLAARPSSPRSSICFFSRSSSSSR